MRSEIQKSYEYIQTLMTPESQLIAKSRASAEKLGLEGISLSGIEMSIIKWILNLKKSRRLLEIGCLTGTSALHLLEAMPNDGLLTTIEKSKEHSQLAEENLKEYIQSKKCELITGDAREVLRQRLESLSFDFILIDANKAAYLEYYEWSIEHLEPGGVIVVDNIFLSGAVWGDSTQQKFNSKQIDQVHKMNQLAFKHPQLKSCIVPTSEGLLFSEKIVS